MTFGLLLVSGLGIWIGWRRGEGFCIRERSPPGGGRTPNPKP